MSIRGARLALALVIEVTWGFAAAAVVVHIFSAQRAGPSLIAVAAVVLGGAALGQFTAASGEGGRRLPIAATTLSLVALFVIAQSEYASAPWNFAWVRSLATHGEPISEQERGVIVGVVALTLLWVRSVGAGARADNAGTLASVLFGLAAVALATVLSPPARGPNLFGVLALAYVPLALVVLSMHQVSDPDRSLRETVAQSGRWLAATIALTLVVAVVVLAIDPRSLGAFAPLARRLPGVLAPIGRPLLFAWGLVARLLLAPVFAVLASIVHIFPSFPHHHQPPQPAMPPLPDELRPHDPPTWQIIVERALAGIVVALLSASGPALIWLSLRRRGRQKRDGHEVRESIEEEPDAGGLIDVLLRRLRRPRRAPATSIAVRRLYHDMLADAAAAGVERRPSATPLQFAPRLDAHYASDAPTAISGAFTRSRYGRAEFDDAAVIELRRRWQTARSLRATRSAYGRNEEGPGVA